LVVFHRHASHADNHRRLRGCGSGCSAVFKAILQMNPVKKMLTSELTICVLLGICAATGVTRPAAPPAPPINIVVVGKSQVPEIQATIYSADWCQPCKQYVREIKEALPADGWVIRSDKDADAVTAHIIVTKSEADWKKLKIEQIPCTIIRKNGKEIQRFVGGKTPDELANRINRLAKESK
jgi:hypothetical protein